MVCRKVKNSTRDRRHTLKEYSDSRRDDVHLRPHQPPKSLLLATTQSLYISIKNPSPPQPTPNPPSTKPSTKHMKPIRHDNRGSSPANTDHAGAYAFRHQEVPRARERGFAWGLNSWEGRREGGGCWGREKERKGGKGACEVSDTKHLDEKENVFCYDGICFQTGMAYIGYFTKGVPGTGAIRNLSAYTPPLSALSKQQSI